MFWLLCSHLGNANHLWFMGHFDWLCSCFVSSEQWKAAETDSSTLCFLHSKFLLICHPPPSIILHTALFAFPFLGFILQIWGIPLAHTIILPLYAKLKYWWSDWLLRAPGLLGVTAKPSSSATFLSCAPYSEGAHVPFPFITPPGRGLLVSLLVQKTSMLPPTFLSACL